MDLYEEDFVNDWRRYIETLRDHMNRHGITVNYVSEKTGFSQSSVSRFFSCKNAPTLKNYLVYLNALDLKLEIVKQN